MEMAGPQVARTRVCGENEAKLDAACCAGCDKNPACHHWVREAGTSGYRWCWLRRNPGGASNNNNRRGGMKKQNLPPCSGTFGDMSGPQVAAYTVWGESDAVLDAACCDKCRKLSSCAFWVRDYRKSFPSSIGGKTCWLRRTPNFNSRSASHPYRRGGMKPTSLLEDSDDNEKDSQMNEDQHVEDLPDPEYREGKDLNLLQTTEQSSLWTVADAHAFINEELERQQIESEAQAQSDAEAMAQAKESAVENSKVTHEADVAEKQTASIQAEQFAEIYNADIPSRIHEHGHRAAMDERGYKAVADLKDSAEMEAYIRRACQFMGFIVKEDGALKGIVPYYSGEKATQSFENLLLELERNAHDDAEEKWIIPEQEEVEDE